MTTSSQDYCLTLIDTIVDALDYAEMTGDSIGFQKARRLLLNDLKNEIIEPTMPTYLVVGVPSQVSVP